MDLLLVLIIIIIPAIAQLFVSINYGKYKQIENSDHLSGQEVAKKILEANDLDLYIIETKGNLTDHYDSSRKTIKLSTSIFHDESIASLAVASHECGHAIQDKEGYFFLKLRSFIYPIVNVATSLSYVIILIGIIAQVLDIVYLGIAFTACGLVFQLVTLPVEFNASRRALKELKKLNLVEKEDESGIKKVLFSAAMTYVAGVLASALQIFRLILLFGRDD